ncbi:MAG: flagellar basal body-associated FliL family protein [Bdellovibrionales bacterium]|nr:flagellar basal body-associated FliL family protein [Bdellovibrionales bacterium]
MAEEKKEEAPATEPEGGDEADAVKKKGAGGAGGGPNPKLILIVLVLNAVVLIVLALVVWKSYVSSSSQVSLSDVAADKDGAKPHGEGGEHGGGEHGGGEHGEKKEGKKEGDAADNYINESFTVNLADSKGAHFVKVDVAIEVEDANVKDEVKRLRPKIRDFINVILSSKNYEQVESSDGRAFLREEIRNKINGYLSRGQIKDVYFTQFVFQ